VIAQNIRMLVLGSMMLFGSIGFGAGVSCPVSVEALYRVGAFSASDARSYQRAVDELQLDAKNISELGINQPIISNQIVKYQKPIPKTCPDRRTPVCAGAKKPDGRPLYPGNGTLGTPDGVCCPAGQVATGLCGISDQKCIAPTPPPTRPTPTATLCRDLVAGPNPVILCGQGNKNFQCLNCCNNALTGVYQPVIPPTLRAACEAACNRAYPKQ
jgi:hypothetical protein